MRTAYIRVEATPQGCEARFVIDWDGRSLPPAGVPSAPLATPQPPPGVQDIREFVVETSDPSKHFPAIGAALHDALLTGPIGHELAVARAGGPVRLLLDIEPEELRTLPWELMRRRTSLLFCDPANPVARVTAPFVASEAVPGRCWPLRVLLVIGSRADDDVVAAEAELDHIRDAFRKHCGLVDLEVLTRPTREDIRKYVKGMRPHVFHYVGHGNHDAEHGGYLELHPKDGDGGTKEWTSEEIQIDLGECPPRLALLNACQSGTEREGTWAAADGLTALQVPAIIAMQGPIGGNEAARFARGFYHSLAQGEAIDIAVARGRVEITDSAPATRRDYALPCLILGAHPDAILDLSDDEHVPRGGRLSVTRRMVDRTERRRQLWDLMRPDGGPGPRVFAITGPQKVGKGSLVRWCLGLSHIWGVQVVYAEFDTRDPTDSHGFLRGLAAALREASGDSGGAALDDIDTLLTDFARRQEEAQGGNPPRRLHPQELYPPFNEALVELTADRSLVIGIDGASAMDAGEWASYAIPELIAPIARGDAGEVRLILALDDAEVRRLDVDVFDAGEVKKLALDPFPREEFAVAAVQYLRAQGYVRARFQATVDDVYQKLAGTWTTRAFDLLDAHADIERWPTET